MGVGRAGHSRGNLGHVTERICQKPACTNVAAYTLTYDYVDSMAVLGPLASGDQLDGVNLCSKHADRLVMPNGWNLVRHVSAPNP